MKRNERFTRSVTAKALVIAALTLLMLIPVAMVREIIRERKARSVETIEKINAKWSGSQQLAGPVLTIPYTTQEKRSNNTFETVSWTFNVVPETLDFDVKLTPEERYFGIYKTILYKSTVAISGEFDGADLAKLPVDGAVDPRHIAIRLGLSDLRGVGDNPAFTLDGIPVAMEASGTSDDLLGAVLEARIDNPAMLWSGGKMAFTCTLELKGSTFIEFIPVGKTTRVNVSGAWPDPGFTGAFTPEYTIADGAFNAQWTVLRFNRNIPDTWIDDNVDGMYQTAFGVNLVNQADHYQQSERSAKYALMFIALTFVIFFFVEVLTRRRIHPIQYLLVGIALVLFFSLLLSISERTGFGWAYLIAATATIALITAYAASVFKNRKPTVALCLFLVILYALLYMILQLEDVAFLIGSIALFIILGVIMYFSRKINWYKADEDDDPTPPQSQRQFRHPSAMPSRSSSGPPPVSGRGYTPPPAPKQASPPVPPAVRQEMQGAKPRRPPRSGRPPVQKPKMDKPE